VQADAPPAARLITDDFARAGFTEKILGEHETIRTLKEGRAAHLVPAMAREPWRVVSVERGADETLACTLAWEGEVPDGAGGAVTVTVRKRYTLRRDLLALRYELENRGAVAARARLALSLDLAAGSDAQVDVEGVAVDPGATRDCGRAQMVTVSDDASRVEVRLLEPTHLWLTPVQTAHLRFGAWREEVQALCLTWVLRLSVAPGETRRVDVKLRAYATTPTTSA